MPTCLKKKFHFLFFNFKSLKNFSFSLSLISMAYRGPLENSFERFSSVPLSVLFQRTHFFAHITPFSTITRLMAYYTNQPQELGSTRVPTREQVGSSAGTTSTPSLDMRTIEIFDNNGHIVRICLLPPVQNTEKDIEQYLKYITSLSPFRFKSTFFPPTPTYQTWSGSTKSMTQWGSGL